MPDTAGIRTLIVFFDGLRPDYITPEGMPNLYAFSQKAAYGRQHHSVFPTVTRVNASSYSTGSYPATNGLMGNTVYFPQVNKTKGLNTGEASDMMKVAEATDGHLLTAISLGEILQHSGRQMMVFSSGSSGQALMQNHKVAGSIINTSMILPEGLKPQIENEIGTIPAGGKPNVKQHAWITDALIRYGLRLDGPLVSAIWFSDPDASAHSDGIGSPLAVQSIQAVDEQFGRILSALQTKGLTNHFNIIISTDHGFATHIGKVGLADFLISQGLKKDKESEDVVVAEGALYVQNHDAALVRKIVQALQQQEWVGALFTKASQPGATTGSVEGTLSFDAVHWNHKDRSADILVDVNWNDSVNTKGYKGASFARGVAGHGSLSPYEVHIALLAAGPSFKPGYQSQLPSSNVDIVPTILQIHKLAIPPAMEGRVLSELLVGSAAPAAQPKEDVLQTMATYPDGTYQFSLHRTLLGKYQYVDYSKVVRVKK
jgi:predicted AlkP superfamily pyrophosphatase or phosphodiesterase